MDPNNRGVDHLHISVMGGNDCINQSVPHASFSPAVEEIVDSGAQSEALRLIALGGA
jgi:hypothetical protein